MSVLLIGTLDTKGVEFAYVRDRLRAAGGAVTVVDAGVLGPPAFDPDISREAVFAAAGTTYDAIKAAGDRGQAVAQAARGVAKIAADLHKQGKVSGVMSLGGSAGTTIGTAAMRALPVGVPKVMVSTLASGDTRPYVETKDLCMLSAVVDVAGLNRVSRRILANAAAAVAGMVQAPPLPEGEDRPLIGATMFGVTTPCVTRAREVLEAAGYEVLVFHATGTGGRAMEDLARGGFLAGVL